MVQHLTWVAELAASNGRSFGAEGECHFAAILHDLGKYGRRFQARLQGTESHIDHWSAGAFEAAMAGRNGFAAALAIQGHHIGLQHGDRDSLAALNIASLLKSHPLDCKLSDDDHEAIKNRAQSEGFSWKAPAKSCFDWAIRDLDPVGQMLAVRMLFSALVDADFIATERHFQARLTHRIPGTRGGGCIDRGRVVAAFSSTRFPSRNGGRPQGRSTRVWQRCVDEVHVADPARSVLRHSSEEGEVGCLWRQPRREYKRL